LAPQAPASTIAKKKKTGEIRQFSVILEEEETRKQLQKLRFSWRKAFLQLHQPKTERGTGFRLISSDFKSDRPGDAKDSRGKELALGSVKEAADEK